MAEKRKVIAERDIQGLKYLDLLLPLLGRLHEVRTRVGTFYISGVESRFLPAEHAASIYARLLPSGRPFQKAG